MQSRSGSLVISFAEREKIEERVAIDEKISDPFTVSYSMRRRPGLVLLAGVRLGLLRGSAAAVEREAGVVSHAVAGMCQFSEQGFTAFYPMGNPKLVV